MRSVRRSLALLVLLPFLAVSVIVSDQPLPPRSGPGRDAPTTLVAMGDSSMSGEGAGDYEPGTNGESGNWCHRSANASINKTVVAGVDRTVNLACSGANSERVGREQASELRDLAGRYRVVAIVVAVGANDDPRFSDVLNRCVKAWFDRKADCTGSMAREWQQRVEQMVPKVERALRDVRAVMRDAGYLDSSYTLVVQSYAAPVAPGLPSNLQNLAGCPLRTDDLEWVRDKAVGELATGIRTAAKRVNARYLDLSKAGVKREACVGGNQAESEWFTRLTVDWDGLRDDQRAAHALQESFHPNARGHAQIGRCLTEFLATSTRRAACVADQDGNLRAVLNSENA